MQLAQWLSVGACAALLGSFAKQASAEAAPKRWRSGEYYALNGSAVAALLASSLAAQSWFPNVAAGPDSCWFPGDLSVRRNHSLPARETSNEAAWAAIGVPIVATFGRGADARFANTELVYAESLSVNTFLQSLVKFSVRRPRPYTYQLGPGAACDTKDCAVSFYSGHASTAFAAAVAGSYLFAESAPNRGSRYAMWSFELALASATASLRVRAGMHYYSDVIVGALAGTGVGVLVPVLHGERYRPSALELASAGGGIVAGIAVSQFVPGDAEQTATASWSIAPAAFRAGTGLELRGAF